jgi:1-deoxy-D-xylulose-5-phosphate reductoisomerase
MSTASSPRRRILLLGSTGSIGTSACNCVRRFPERFEFVGLSANTNHERLAALAHEFSPVAVCIGSGDSARQLREQLPNQVGVHNGVEGLVELVAETEYDILLNALVGAVGFRPTVTALSRGKTVALANKESLVIGGELITSLLAEGRGALLPVDSEHSAILQCLNGEHSSSVESIVLTASGGPFRTLPVEEFEHITPARALDHPTWSMGPKITIDAATLMNKGFEAIEAHHLFAVSYDTLKVVVHPQSIIHSMVVYHDGAVMAQCGIPDMELPIQYALSYPERLPFPTKRLDLAAAGSLTFEQPDTHRFPALRLCLEAGRAGGTLPTVLNAANEVAVNLFLDRRIGFNQIAAVVEHALERHTSRPAMSVELIEQIDRETRERVRTEHRK